MQNLCGGSLHHSKDNYAYQTFPSMTLVVLAQVPGRMKLIPCTQTLHLPMPFICSTPSFVRQKSHYIVRGCSSLCTLYYLDLLFKIHVFEYIQKRGREVKSKNKFILFLDQFAKLRKRLLASSCLPVRPHRKLRSHWTDFHEI